MSRFRWLTYSFSIALIPMLSLAGDQVYQYKSSHGSPLFTDKKLPNQKPVSVKYYGRPPAYKSCNQNHKEMEQRIKSYMPFIRTMGNKYMIKADLIKAVIITESCFNPKAVSPVGAQGLMQLMPKTARLLGVNNAFDPFQNIEGGVTYLRMMLDQFNQDKKLALAAYNAGPSAVKKYGRVPPYRETQQYVKKIMKML